MTRDDRKRLDDIAIACVAVRNHLARGDMSDGLIFDAVRMRLVEIGEAAKSISAELLATEPDIPWTDVIRMRDLLAHHYFDTVHSIVEQTATKDLIELQAAVDRIIARVSQRPAANSYSAA